METHQITASVGCVTRGSGEDAIYRIEWIESNQSCSHPVLGETQVPKPFLSIRVRADDVGSSSTLFAIRLDSVVIRSLQLI